MSGNPLIDQGVLNRILGSVTWNNFPGLNVTAPFLDKEGINLRLEGESSLQHGTMTGLVQSPEPYMAISVVIALLKTQQLSDLYKAQMEDTALIGDGTVRPDAATLPVYPIINCAIQSVRELNFAGDDADFAVAIRGYYLVNSSLWD